MKQPCETCGEPTDLIDELFDEPECESCKENREERAYDRAMDRALEDSGDFESTTDRQLRDAGRGHLVRR